MTPKFLTNQEAQNRIAELESQLRAATAGGVTNSARDIDSDEAILALMKSDRLKREAAKGASNAAQPTASAAAVAVKARLDASKAMLAAAEAKARAKAAAAAITPGLITAKEFAAPPLRMTREEFSKLSPADKSRFSKTGGRIV